jgi:hypothetical protein
MNKDIIKDKIEGVRRTWDSIPDEEQRTIAQLDAINQTRAVAVLRMEALGDAIARILSVFESDTSITILAGAISELWPRESHAEVVQRIAEILDWASDED